MLESGPLAALCRAVNDDKIDRSANHRVIENTSHEARRFAKPGCRDWCGLWYSSGP